MSDDFPQVCGARVRGDVALAQGALAAGVQVVTGYPGSPATGVFEYLQQAGEFAHIEWAANEKVAMELAAGASLGGSRAMVVLKSVGLNVGLDPLATLSMTGCRAGLVILLGDDPGGWGSQNEQDSRWLARVAEVPIVEPTSVRQSAALVAQAFAWSEAVGMPIIVRATRSLTRDEGHVEPAWQLPPSRRRFLRRRNRWVSYPPLVVRRHRSGHRRLRQMAHLLEASPYDTCSGQGHLGVIAAGHTFSKLLQVLDDSDPSAPSCDSLPELPLAVQGLSSSWPLPEQSLARWLRPIDQLLVLEEGSSFIEEQLYVLIHRLGLHTKVHGRTSRALPLEGELTLYDIDAALQSLWPTWPAKIGRQTPRPPEPSELCEDCLYRPIFDALARAMEKHGGPSRFLVIGETGCMVQANERPWELFDVKLSLGSALGLALGMSLSDTRRRVVALVGDSCFFHSDFNALPQLVAIDPHMLIIILDNGTTALTGGQAHPGSATDSLGRPRHGAVAIPELCRACGVAPLQVAAGDGKGIEQSLTQALGRDGLTIVIAQAPCQRHTIQEQQT